MCSACGAYGGEGRCTRGVVGKPRVKNRLEDPDVAGMILLKWGFNSMKNVGWVNLPQDRCK